MAEKIYLVSLGCPKNLIDSEVMLGYLHINGYQISQSAEQADILLINTCGFIQSAVEESIEEILRLARFKEDNPGKLLVVSGCLVQRYGAELSRELPEVDIFIGTDGFQNIIRELADRKPAGRTIALKPHYIMNSSTPRLISTPAHRAYLKISEGCQNSCAFCLIPGLRGPLRSRLVDDIVREAQQLESRGVKELTLVAQDLTAYGLDLGRNYPDLTMLVEKILAGCTIPWLRLLYLYPSRLSTALLQLMAAEPRLLPYLDIPLQHVSPTVLKAMNRPFGPAHIHDVIDNIRAIIPQAAIRTTLMVGFPGETENDVQQLEKFLEDKQLDHVGIFTYANEEGCAAAGLSGQCREEVKEERRQRLMTLQADISLKKQLKMIGKIEQVLVEGISDETDLLLEGRTRFQAPEIDGRVYITHGRCNAGDLVKVQIAEAFAYDLAGEIIEN
jgi:ribosomal protein S12 methylthiotransferase